MAETIRRATLADVPALLRLERGPGYERLVGRSEAMQHAAWIAAPDCAVWIAETSEPLAFALLTGIGDVHSGVYLKRIAAHAPGTGVGSRLLAHVLRWTFEEAGAPRFSLDVLIENTRARSVYARAGLREEGVMRGSYALPDGARTDRVLMAVLAEEWRARTPTAGSESSTNR